MLLKVFPPTPFWRICINWISSHKNKSPPTYTCTMNKTQKYSIGSSAFGIFPSLLSLPGIGLGTGDTELTSSGLYLDLTVEMRWRTGYENPVCRLTGTKGAEAYRGGWGATVIEGQMEGFEIYLTLKLNLERWVGVSLTVDQGQRDTLWFCVP